VQLAQRAPAAGARGEPQRHEDDDGWRGARDAHAWHADGGADEGTGCRPGPGLRPPLSHLHDPAPQGRRVDGEGSLRRARRGTGRNRLQVRFRCRGRSDNGDQPHVRDVARVRLRFVSPQEAVMPLVFRRLGLAAVTVLAACGTATPPATPPTPQKDPRVGLKAGLMNAGEAVSNLRILAKAVSPPGFAGITNSDLAFMGNYAIQGNYNGLVLG